MPPSSSHRASPASSSWQKSGDKLRSRFYLLTHPSSCLTAPPAPLSSRPPRPPTPSTVQTAILDSCIKISPYSPQPRPILTRDMGPWHGQHMSSRNRDAKRAKGSKLTVDFSIFLPDASREKQASQ